MYDLDGVIKLLEDIGNRGGISSYGQEYPNAECCYDAANTLRKIKEKAEARPERKTRLRAVTGCTRCDKPQNISVGDCCPDCGGTFLEGAIVHDYIIKEYFVPIKTVWYKPSTWEKGKWVPADFWDVIKNS